MAVWRAALALLVYTLAGAWLFQQLDLKQVQSSGLHLQRCSEQLARVGWRARASKNYADWHSLLRSELEKYVLLLYVYS